MRILWPRSTSATACWAASKREAAFQIERQQVAENRWKTSVLNVHISGRIVLFKAISKDQREVRSNFQPVSSDLSVPGAVALLNAMTSR